MASANDVMAILKAVSIKIDADTIAILSFMYHTETDPLTGKTNRAKSQYRYEGRIVKIADLQKEIEDMKAKPTDAWKWPTLEDWRCSYDCEATNARGAKWLESRIKKALDWPTAEKVLGGWKPAKNDIKESRKYDITDYVSDGNTPMSITLDALVTLGAGHTFNKVLKAKTAKA